jgi:hypothetical protein
VNRSPGPRRRAIPDGRLTLMVLVLGIVGSAIACGLTPPTIEPSPASPSASPSATAAPSASTVAPSLPAPSSSADLPPSLPAGVTVDPGLLEVLPTSVADVPLVPDPDTAAEVAADPLLAESALSIAVALAAAPTSTTDDLAVASVIRLRPDVFDEAFYQEWRDTYNEAACEVADGVDSETSTLIADLATYVGTCVGGAQTYHTYLEDQGFIVSVTSTGQQNLGEQIIAGLAR